MNTNKEVIVNLISLLVKKTGFNFDDGSASEELNRIKESMDRLSKERDNSEDKESVQKLIDNLEQRQNFWKENAQIIGKELIEAYEDDKSLGEVKPKIERLSKLANQGTENMQVGYIYSKISELEKKSSDLRTNINNNKYICEEEKEIDINYKSYLENKINSIEKEISEFSKELELLKESEEKDLSILNKIKDYNETLNNNLKTVENIFNSNVANEISFDVWERLEITKNSIEEKISKSNDVLAKTQNMLDDVRKNISDHNLMIESLEDTKKRCNNKLNNVNNKLEKNDYINIAKKILDISNYEMMKVEIELLKNKKDVIYVDADKVEQELMKAWTNENIKIDDNTKENGNDLVKEEITALDKEAEIEVNDIEDIKETATEDVSNIENKDKKDKYELDW